MDFKDQLKQIADKISKFKPKLRYRKKITFKVKNPNA